MMINYAPLWVLLNKKGKKKTDLLEVMASSTLAKLGKNANVNTEVIDRICAYLGCDVADVMRFVPEDEVERKGGASGKPQGTSTE